jgi:dUTP pyrophosphatase
MNNILNIKIKKTNPNAIIPSYSKPGDAGMDLTAISKEVVDKGEYGYIAYDFGLALEIPEGYVGLIFPRSSCSNTGAIMSNSVGVIDSSYRGSISARFKQIKGTKEYEIGDRVAQLIIVPYPQVTFEEVSELNETVRGAGGYGSTGS